MYAGAALLKAPTYRRGTSRSAMDGGIAAGEDGTGSYPPLATGMDSDQHINVLIQHSCNSGDGDGGDGIKLLIC